MVGPLPPDLPVSMVLYSRRSECHNLPRHSILVPFSQHSLHPAEALPPENVFDFKLTNHLLNAVSNLPLQTSSSLPSQFTYTNENPARSSSLSL